MPKHSLPLLLAGGILVLWFSLHSTAAPKPGVPQQPAPGAALTRLTIVPSPGLTGGLPGNGIFDAGFIDPLEQPRIEHVFLLRNDTQSAITIESLKPQCGCTSAFLQKETVTKQALIPGAQTALHVTVNTGMQSGNFHEYVWVNATGAVHPVAILEVVGHARQLITMTPDRLNFGHVIMGEPRLLPLTITADSRLLARGPMPQLHCFNPDIDIREHGKAALEVSAESPGSKRIVCHYLVTLSPRARAGNIYGTISFAGGTDAVEPAAAAAVFAHASAQLSGEVAAKAASSSSHARPTNSPRTS